jgi:hypothetical protein
MRSGPPASDRGVTRREQERRIAFRLAVHDPWSRTSREGVSGSGERCEGEHHQAPPIDLPAKDGTSHHGQEHHRLRVAETTRA